MSTGLRAARVRQGIAELDLHHGEGWPWIVDPDRVNVRDPWDDVLAQVYADQPRSCCPRHRGEQDMGLDRVSAFAAGLYAEESEAYVFNRLWSFAIRRLREQRPREVGA